MDNYTFEIITAIVVIFAVYIFFIEPRLIKAGYCNLYKGPGSITAVQLTDLHLNSLKVSRGKIKKMISSASPDILFITGDMIDEKHELELLDKFLDDLAFEGMIYITLGNHDMRVFKTDSDIEGFRSFLSKYGNIRLLHNEKTVYTKEGRSLEIIGAADTLSGFYDPAIIADLAQSSKKPAVVLSHNPDTALDVPPDSDILIISGHLHGGQIWMPFEFEFKILRDDLLPKAGYKQGYYEVAGNSLYISRGVGTCFINARFLSRPELTVYTL